MLLPSLALTAFDLLLCVFMRPVRKGLLRLR